MSSHWIRYLVLIKLTVLEGWLSLWLEGDDDEAHEDVDHEECNDDDVDKVENGNVWTVVVLGTDIRRVWVNGDVENSETVKDETLGKTVPVLIPWPPFKGCHHEECKHGPDDIVVVELVPGPVSVLDHRLSPDDPLLVDEVLPLTCGLLQHHPVGAHPELALEELDPDDSKYEEEEDGDEDYVVDGLHSHDDALDHVLEALGSVDCPEHERVSLTDGSAVLFLPQGSEYSEDSENFNYRDGARTENKQSFSLYSNIN